MTVQDTSRATGWLQEYYEAVEFFFYRPNLIGKKRYAESPDGDCESVLDYLQGENFRTATRPTPKDRRDAQSPFQLLFQSSAGTDSPRNFVRARG